MSVGGGSLYPTINSGLLMAYFELGDIHNFRVLTHYFFYCLIRNKVLESNLIAAACKCYLGIQYFNMSVCMSLPCNGHFQRLERMLVTNVKNLNIIFQITHCEMEVTHCRQY